MSSILQDWVQELGLRHQGCLISTIRGCDVVGKQDVSKHLLRQIRGLLLIAHCKDNKKAQTFMEAFDKDRCKLLMENFRKNTDHYPIHFFMHLFHSCQIIGYKYPEKEIRKFFNEFYLELCYGLHINAETEEQMDQRLDADEDTFAKNANCSTVICLEKQKFDC